MFKQKTIVPFLDWIRIARTLRRVDEAECILPAGSGCKGEMIKNYKSLILGWFPVLS